MTVLSSMLSRVLQTTKFFHSSTPRLYWVKCDNAMHEYNANAYNIRIILVSRVLLCSKIEKLDLA